MGDTASLIRRYFSAFNSGDIAGILDCLCDGVRHDAAQYETTYGKAAFAEYCSVMAGCYRERLTDIEIMVAPRGNRAAAEFIAHGEYCETEPGEVEARGQRYTLTCGVFFEVRNDCTTRVTSYYSVDDWVRQMGL